MAAGFSCVMTFLVTFVFLCSGQSVCKPPPEEKCSCNQVVNVGPDEGLKFELDRLKIVVDQLSQKIANWSEDRVSTLEEQLAQERTIRAELEGRVNGLQEELAHVQNTSAQQNGLSGKLKNDLCSATPKLGRLFQVRSPAGDYKYDLDEARHACAEQDATLASYDQLYQAWKDGLGYCLCGWLSDETARYPTQIPSPGCGVVGINDCGWLTQYNAWCFRALSFCG
ncbi:PREDICTED: hyaluronan and proteoglycan link protein 4-like [Branchiostoma belcheri]|uniref:Hyaluronan and proteoglycan link protein 4-like n=1 Tax=Branchiostoma belcheri TaxID=7741 RepID=A0A6P4YGF6_BRABE|nr:PREDICTED: hyaluronan and proteoglycan link protein 4-like [Branchiostoma belcheri]